MILFMQRVASPVGEILLVSDEDGAVRALDFHDYEPRMQLLLRRYYGGYQLQAGRAPGSVTDALDAYFAGDRMAIETVTVATGGTAFQREVWDALRSIPSGSTVTYTTLAQTVGRPAARRAVGLANGANPIAIIVPCHRVIGADGSLTGYGGGLERKRWLLEHEALTH